MVDAQGKPYAKKINPINQDEEVEETRTDWNEESQVIGSIAGKAVSLNWL
jgi:hypothetical protein